MPVLLWPQVFSVGKMLLNGKLMSLSKSLHASNGLCSLRCTDLVFQVALRCSRRSAPEDAVACSCVVDDLCRFECLKLRDSVEPIDSTVCSLLTYTLPTLQPMDAMKFLNACAHMRVRSPFFRGMRKCCNGEFKVLPSQATNNKHGRLRRPDGPRATSAVHCKARRVQCQVLDCV